MSVDLPLAAFVDVLEGTVFALFFIVAFLMMVIILLQEGKGGGLAGAFGGAGAETFGVKAGTVNKLTAWISTAFLVLALLHAGLSTASLQRDLDKNGSALPEGVEEAGEADAADAAGDGTAAADGAEADTGGGEEDK